ncbi:MAG: hypothetical protein A3G35_10770 [candidate division NC10 bacterium RIFCSPLOWO2_12_FULL_66_18]|jgi:hypothetical protein|nr:MAG: hypothetical protein A3G35_10770 [candidate division NC10 bacterium RIFCSPLOWO2_12_FULL_66_18]
MVTRVSVTPSTTMKARKNRMAAITYIPIARCPRGSKRRGKNPIVMWVRRRSAATEPNRVSQTNSSPASSSDQARE